MQHRVRAMYFFFDLMLLMLPNFVTLRENLIFFWLCTHARHARTHAHLSIYIYRMPTGMKLFELYSQCPEHCGPDFEYMCAIVSLCNSYLLMSAREEALDPQMTPALVLQKWKEHKQRLQFRGIPPTELEELAHLCGRHSKLLSGGGVSSLSVGDVVYLQGTGLLNTQMSEEDHFEQPYVDSHVVVVYSATTHSVTFVNPDRRKSGKRNFHSGVNGFFTVTHDQLTRIWKVRRPDGATYTGAVLTMRDG